MSDLYIPNGYFHLWQMYLSEQGIDVLSSDLWDAERTQIQYVLTLPIDSQSPFLFFYSLIEKTQRLQACPQLVFEMAKYVRPEHFGVLGYMASRSNSVAEALQYILRFSRLVIDGEGIIPMQIQQHGQNIHLIWPFVHEKYVLVNELTNALMVHLARQLLAQQYLPLHRVHFAHDAQMALYHYQKFYGCEILFQQQHYCLVVGLEGLSLKPEHADPLLTQLLVKQAEDAIASKPQAENVQQQVHLRIAEYLRLYETAPKIEHIAQALHVSVRSLQRQLVELEASFKQILEIERMKRGEFLLDQNLSFSDVATRLGYSDQSALARAYKRYAGQTLLQYKKKKLEDESRKDNHTVKKGNLMSPF